MDVHLKLRNYRGFSDRRPAEISFGPGFTALVGSNNSGKSSLLRFLYDFRSLFETLGDEDQRRIKTMSQDHAFGFSPRNTSTEGLFHNGNDRDLGFDIIASLNENDEEVRLQIDYTRQKMLIVRHTPPAATGLGPAVTYPDAGLGKLLSSLSDTLYVGAFRNALNFAPASALARAFADPVYFDLRMGQPFVEWWGEWKGGRDRVGNETAFHLTRDIGRIFGLGQIEINATPSSGEFQIFSNSKSYRLDEFGSGLTQFLVVLANAAYRRPAWILIDEPELNLHPALQLDFLTTLASYAKIGVLFATHSLGLARSVGERIYACSRGPDGEQIVRRFESVTSLPEFLGELSFAAHRELGFESVLLVEGSTDVTVLQQLLRRAGKERQFVLLPLGGAATINGRSEAQLAEICRIAPEVVALIDSERTAAGAPLSNDREAFVASCTRLGIRCHVLERRAIENYLPERAIHVVKGNRYRALGPFETLKELKLGWAKSENWRIAAETRPEEIEQTDLGAFISSL